MPTRPLTDAPEVAIASRADLRDRLMTFKAADPARHVPYADIVDQLLCFGWVDSLPRAKDAARTMLYISRRKPGSNWRRVNKEKVARLTAAGQMMAPGLAVVARAQADGAWAALDGVENGVIPPELATAFAATPGTATIWDGFPKSVKRGALKILKNAKRPDTRARKVAEIVAACVANERLFQWRGKR